MVVTRDVPSSQNAPTATERVFNGYPLNADVAPIADPFFQPLLAVVGSTAVVENATGSLICLL